MKFFNFTLLTDGSSDKALIPHLRWLLKQNGVSSPIVSQWANDGLSRLREKPVNLAERINRSIELFPCDLLFIHRDVERETIEDRKREVERALGQISNDDLLSVNVFPIRMTEAWLLFDKYAIRRASGNPNGRVNLNLPKLKSIETEPNPKSILHELLKKASEFSGRKLHRFNVNHSVSLVAENTEDFSPLRELSAFALLESDIRKALKHLNLISE